jgi:hypothetical protein
MLPHRKRSIEIFKINKAENAENALPKVIRRNATVSSLRNEWSRRRERRELKGQ